MEPGIVLLIALSALLALLVLRVPIAVAIGVVSFAGIALIRNVDVAFAVLGNTPLEFAANWTLSAIPMFLFMGSIAHRSGLTRTLFDAGRIWLGQLPGGLALATVAATAIFSAASGSSVATTAAMGRIAVPEMLRFRYDPGLASASVAAAGTLGSTIPPSIAFILFGWYTQTPVGALLIAGIVPGILTALVFGVFIVGYCLVRKDAAPPPPKEEISTAQRWAALWGIWPIPLLIVSVIGVIYSGIATPTEAAALGALAAIFIALVKGGLTFAIFWDCVRETLLTVASLLFIAVSAVVFVRFLTLAGVPPAIEAFGRSLEPGAITMIVFTAAILLVLGMFLDPLGILLVTIPVLLPLWRVAGIDMIWMGVLFAKLTEIGLLTPPVGMNAFVIRVVTNNEIPLKTIFKGLIWFVVFELLLVALIVAFPSIATFLPATMG